MLSDERSLQVWNIRKLVLGGNGTVALAADTKEWRSGEEVGDTLRLASGQMRVPARVGIYNQRGKVKIIEKDDKNNL